VTNLPPGVTLHVQVVAGSSDSLWELVISTGIDVTTTGEELEPVTGLEAAPQSGNSVRLSWDNYRTKTNSSITYGIYFSHGVITHFDGKRFLIT